VNLKQSLQQYGSKLISKSFSTERLFLSKGQAASLFIDHAV